MDRIEDVDPGQGGFSHETRDKQPVVQGFKQLGKKIIQNRGKAELQQPPEAEILTDAINMFFVLHIILSSRLFYQLPTSNF